MTDLSPNTSAVVTGGASDLGVAAVRELIQRRPMEFGRLAHHLLENDMMNGETVRLDGAIRMRPR
jgi:hypothetical protein